MRATSLMFYLCAIVFGLMLWVSTPIEKEIVRAAALKIAMVIKSNALILWEKVQGTEPYYIESEEDCFEGSEIVDCDDLSKSGIFDSSRTLNVKTKWDGDIKP